MANYLARSNISESGPRRLDPDQYRRLYGQVLDRDGWRCQFCGSREKLHVHHIQFRSRGGGDTDRNLITVCAQCHGEAAEGGKKAPTLRAAEVQEAPAGAIFWILTNGVVRRGMPVWSKLPEPQRWQLVSYIKSLGVPAMSETLPGQRGPRVTARSSPPR